MTASPYLPYLELHSSPALGTLGCPWAGCYRDGRGGESSLPTPHTWSLQGITVGLWLQLECESATGGIARGLP